MSSEFRVLTVCTANICRSPAAATLLRRELAPVPVRIESAGVAAIPGTPACDLSSALVGEYVARHYGTETGRQAPVGAHRSRPVTAGLVGEMHLILTLDRSHRSALAALAPPARSRTFTLRQAAALAEGVAGAVRTGGVPSGAPPLPSAPLDRLGWLVSELDAARGLVSVTAVTEPGGNGPRSTGQNWHGEDVPDPHVLGYQIHPMAVELIEDAVERLAAAIDTVLASEWSGATPDGP